MKDIECPRCYRISFEWESHKYCTECHWMVRPPEVAEPYGFDVLIEIYVRPGEVRHEERHFKGTVSRAKSAGKKYGRVVAFVPLTEKQYRDAYGEGRM